MLHSPFLYTWLKPLGVAVGVTLLSTSALFANEPLPDTPEAAPTTLLDAFPAPTANYERHVIHLPIGNYENNLKIELLAGKIEETDCNATHYSGLFEEKTLEGWGYNYYELSDLSGPVSTRMACSDEQKTLQFVPVHSNGSLLQYNSRLPVVVYLPTGLTLRWRTWVATPYNTASIE